MLIDFRERKREGEREGKIHQLVAFCRHPDWGLNLDLGMCPDRQPNQRDLSVCRMTPNQLSHTGQEIKINLKKQTN